MEDSILTSTKKILGLAADYTAFDEDVLMHLNSTFSVLHQLGVGPVEGFPIEDDTTTWSSFLGDVPGLNMVRSYVFLKVRLLFDPPPTSFAISAMEKQIEEMEWRINTQREFLINPYDSVIEEVEIGG